jgi:hypothetical protein
VGPDAIAKLDNESHLCCIAAIVLEGPSNMKPKHKKVLPPPRVRREYPTIDEAVAAAQGLSSDPDAQIEIAAGLMGVSEDDVRPHLPKLPPHTVSIAAGTRLVLVERRPIRARVAARPVPRV